MFNFFLKLIPKFLMDYTIKFLKYTNCPRIEEAIGLKSILLDAHHATDIITVTGKLVQKLFSVIIVQLSQSLIIQRQ